MDSLPLREEDARSTVNPAIRNWFVEMSGIPIPELIDPVPRAHPWETLYYGDLGDHRREELTAIALAPVIVPARNPPFQSFRTEMFNIESVFPQSLEVEVENPALAQKARDMLSRWRPLLLRSDVPLVLSEVRLNPNNVRARAIARAEDMIVMADGNWATTSLTPDRRPQRWEQFLALGVHPGAFTWTEIPDTGMLARPRVIEELDDCKEGLNQSLYDTVVAPLAAARWEQTILCYQPFATRMHVTTACEYRVQDVGYHLLLMLIWTQLHEVTEAARKYREKCIKDRHWAECVYKEPNAAAKGQNPVSEWVKVIVKPGDMLLIPPGTFVVEYSSGAGVATEGRFLPWTCLPKLAVLSTPPDVYILMAMLLTAPGAEQGGRATPDAIVALAELVKRRRLVVPPGAEVYAPKFKGMEDRAKDMCKQYQQPKP